MQTLPRLSSALAPRRQRDTPRILTLTKAHAILNWNHGDRPGEGTIKANQDDIDAAFELYEMVATPNEVGLSPQVYDTYEPVIKPLLSPEHGVRKEEIPGAYFRL